MPSGCQQVGREMTSGNGRAEAGVTTKAAMAAIATTIRVRIMEPPLSPISPFTLRGAKSLHLIQAGPGTLACFTRSKHTSWHAYSALRGGFDTSTRYASLAFASIHSP